MIRRKYIIYKRLIGVILGSRHDEEKGRFFSLYLRDETNVVKWRENGFCAGGRVYMQENSNILSCREYTYTQDEDPLIVLFDCSATALYTDKIDTSVPNTTKDNRNHTDKGHNSHKYH